MDADKSLNSSGEYWQHPHANNRSESTRKQSSFVEGFFISQGHGDDITGLSLLSLFFIVQSFTWTRDKTCPSSMAKPSRKSVFVPVAWLIYIFFSFGMEDGSVWTGLFFSPVITFYDIGATTCFVTCYEFIHCLAHTFNKYLLDECIKLCVIMVCKI